jgi:predicted kinase
VLLVGPAGSGKTTLAKELGELLGSRSKPYALVDLDWLGWVGNVRVTVHEVLFENLRRVWETLRQAGVERLVLARNLESAGELQALREALSGVDLLVVAVEAPREVLEARLRSRDSGDELAEHLAMIAEARPSVPADLTVQNHGRSLHETALEILRRAAWD